jgi:hypothetical protein
MKLYAAIWYDTDGFTYGCNHCLGVFSTRTLADDYLLRYCEVEKNYAKLEDCHVDEVELDKEWE